jgi:glutaredoxin 2
MITLAIKDETLSGTIISSIDIDFDVELVTVKHIIEMRVKAEVEKYNRTLTQYFNGLVQPSEAERTLNGFKMKARQAIDVEKQVFVALSAFQQNAFFVLVNDRQVESLNEEVFLSKTSSVSFMKLTPLVGG